jgi:hypothetical protein
METLVNPVSDYYSNYKFKVLPVVLCENYDDVLKKASSVTSSCILLSKTKMIVKDRNLSINNTYDSKLDVVLILNVELRGTSTLKVSGKNYTLSNIDFIDGDANLKPSFVVEISAENLKLVNFSMKNVKCGLADLDYICVKTTAKNFQMYNSRLNGKSNNGVFLRLDFPLNNYLKCCVFENFSKTSAANGGEMVRLATSQYEKNDANCVIDQCYFSKCLGDPEVLSVKCSSNTIKNCIFENNGSSKLVLRHAHKAKVSNCYFSGSGMRVYGTNHTIDKIQLCNEANILLDNKSGSSYVRATNVTVTDVYHDNVKTPVTNNGKDCIVKNVVKGLTITKKDLLSVKAEDPIPTPDPTPDPDPTPTPDPDPIPDPTEPKIIVIPAVVDTNKIYKLNAALTPLQVDEILQQFELKFD